jgi:hypothetical protein
VPSPIVHTQFVSTDPEEEVLLKKTLNGSHPSVISGAKLTAGIVFTMIVIRSVAIQP